jgi:hypothetical protein
VTGLSTLTVELDDVAAGGTWPYDISSRVSTRDGWDLSRGRNDEQDDIEVAIAHLSLKNDDGALTLGSASFGGVNVDRRLRITETYSATVYRRCVGYVQNWPTEWPSPHGNIARARITVSDRQSRLNRRKLRSVTEHEIIADSPFAFYTLGEAAGAISAGDTSGNGRPVLTLAGTGTAPAFGAAATTNWDPATGCAFAGGQYLNLDTWPVSSGAAATVECILNRATVPGSAELAWAWIGSSLVDLEINAATGTVSARLGGVLVVTSGANLCDGTDHHLAVTISTVAGTTTIELYVDGVTQGTTATATTSSGPALRVGGGVAGIGGLNATLRYVVISASVLSAARILVHANAVRNGFNTDRADQRMARLASYANIPVGEQSYETGQQPSIAAQSIDGVSALEAMRAVAQAEGGVQFINGSGQHVLHNKSHRPLRATGAVALALTAADLDAKNPPKFAGDKNYLVNTVTGSRAGGAIQRSVNQASVNKYEEYPADRSNALLPTDELMLNQLTWATAMYAEVGHRISELTIDLLTLDTPAKVQAALALELGDRVTVASLPAQSPIATADLIVEGIKETQKTDTWTLTLNTVPSAVYQAWILGDATFSQLGVTTRLYQ